MFLDPSHIDPSLDSRSVTFENPTSARGAGGQTYDGRKGRPSATIPPGETVVLADLDGPGTLRHLWMTFPPAPPETMRALWMEVFYDGADEPSVSVPCLDFFGMPHGRPVRYASALMSAQEGRGFNSYLPMPFAQHVHVEVTNSAPTPMLLYYQIDYTLEPARRHGQLPARCVPSREPDRVAARLRHRRRPRRSRPVRRLQRRRARARRGHVVRRGRAEGVPRRRRASSPRSAAPASRTTSGARGASGAITGTTRARR